MPGDFEGRELSAWLNNELIRGTANHVVERGLELLAPLGIERPRVNFGLPVDEPASLAMSRFVIERGLGGGFALINTGAGWPSKLWPAHRYAQVARFLGAEKSLPSIVSWAGDDEHRLALEIVSRAGGHACLAPPTSLCELAALARRAQLFIGSDTGPLHIAAAVGTPCVGLYGPMPARWCGPYGPQHIAVQKVEPPAKLKDRRRATNASMLAITVDDVCGACDQILSRRGARRPVLAA
jgi:ADP-heptose:LPS heptosyltransferase